MIALLTVEQVADQLQVPVDTLYYWRSKSTGPQAIKVGKYLRYRESDVDAWIESLSPEGNVTPLRRRA